MEIFFAWTTQMANHPKVSTNVFEHAHARHRK